MFIYFGSLLFLIPKRTWGFFLPIRSAVASPEDAEVSLIFYSFQWLIAIWFFVTDREIAIFLIIIIELR